MSLRYALAIALLVAPARACQRPTTRAHRSPAAAGASASLTPLEDPAVQRALEAGRAAERASMAGLHEQSARSSAPFGRNRNEEIAACDEEMRAAYGCPDQLAQEVLERDAQSILAARVRPRRTQPWPSWDRRALAPATRRTFDRLGVDERVFAALRRNGFAVPTGGEHYDSPYAALREIYRRELPLYLTADSLLHAVFRSHEALVALLEAPLAEKLAEALEAAHEALASAAARWPREAARDVDLYLTVARSLLAGAPVRPSYPETRAEAERFVELATGAREQGAHALFGRARVIDFTSFSPRGPYSESEERQRWFRGAMWLSRLEFNVVSRECRSSQPGFTPDPTETPREAIGALALAELLARDDVRPAIERADALWAALAGRREDLTPAELTALRTAARIEHLDEPRAFERLASVIGATHPRTARTHPMPQGVARLPVIATVLGPRVVPDAAMTRPLVHDEVQGRYELGAADVAYALGHEHAARYLTRDFAHHPALREGFARARAVALAPMRGDDLYGAWLDAVRSLARAPAGVLPSFMCSEAWGDLRMNSIVAGYGQLRHANVLVAASSYDGAACAIPDAYVDPTPALYDALLEYARRMRALTAREGDWLDEQTRADLTRYLDECERTYRVLQRIVADELAGHALTAAQRRFVGSVVEVLPSSDGSPLHTGWYLDLFPGVEVATKTGAFVADWYASVNAGRVSYLGVRETRLGLFVVDRGGPPRLMVGPVPDAYEYAGPLARRVNDEDISSVPASDLRAPWSASYAVTPVPPPPIEVTTENPWDDGGDLPRTVARRLRVRAPSDVGVLRVEYLDVDGRVVARGEGRVGPVESKISVRWLPSVLRRVARHQSERENASEDEAGGAASSLVCGRRLRIGAWVDVSLRHPEPGDGCSLDSAGSDIDTTHPEGSFDRAESE